MTNINFLNPPGHRVHGILKDRRPSPSSACAAPTVSSSSPPRKPKKDRRVSTSAVRSVSRRVTGQDCNVDPPVSKELYNEQLRMKAIPNLISPRGRQYQTGRDEIFQTGFITNNNVSITGASARQLLSRRRLCLARQYQAREV